MVVGRATEWGLNALQKLGDRHFEGLGKYIDCADRCLLAAILKLADKNFPESR